MGHTILEAEAVDVRFGGTHALRGVSIAVAAGEIVALMGENGAGKSTLVRCLSGEIEPHAGTIRVAAEPLMPATPRRAFELGIAVIHQELNYVGTLSVAENLALGRPPRRPRARFLVDHAALRRDARKALETLAPDLNVDAEMSSLRVADQQLVEIARAISAGARAILMDEPTAALNAAESERLFRAIRSLRDQGIAIVYISHRLEEVLQLADRMVVLRDGSVVATHDQLGSMTRDQLIQEIVGRELVALLDSSPEADVIGRATRLSLDGVSSELGIEDVTLDVRHGEVVGFFGLAGSGVEHIAKAITGAIPTTGTVAVDGVLLRRRSPATARDAGVVLVPADRRSEGIFGGLSLADNIAIGRQANVGSLRLALPAHASRLARTWIENVDIRPSDWRLPVGGLSGGNQQKSVFARWLATEPRVLVLDEPTRGVDVGAKAQMYSLIQQASADGASAVVVSSEAGELLAVCHRVAVVRNGRIVNIFESKAIDEQTLVATALGAIA